MAVCCCRSSALHQFSALAASHFRSSRMSSPQHQQPGFSTLPLEQFKCKQQVLRFPSCAGKQQIKSTQVAAGAAGRAGGALVVQALKAGGAEGGGGGGGAVAAPLPEALLFDCDGVLVDTERDGHRISFNIAFSEKGLDTLWDVDLYGELLKIGGGKERMTHYFNKVGWPEAAPDDVAARKGFVADLHKRKTNLFMDLVEKGSLPLRPGVARLVDQALDSGVNVAVCSTSNEKAVSAIVRVMLGPERAANIPIFAGDAVPRKKPDPAIYLLASTSLGVSPERSVVVEDSHIGLTAAKAAGMKCIVTKSGYTENEDFAAADAVFECIGDPPTANFDLDFAASLLASPAKSVA